MSAPATTRVAVCQLALAVGESEANRAAGLTALDAAIEQGAQLIVLPELSNSGYMLRDRAEAITLAETIDGPTISDWSARCHQYDVVIVGGFCEQTGPNEVANSAAIIDATGVRAIYRKAHLWDKEKAIFVPGARLPTVIDTNAGRISTVICYDLDFAEHVRVAATLGADILAVPTNWPHSPRPTTERSFLIAGAQFAAYTNKMYVAVADRCATERGCAWTSGSVIVGHDGYPLAGPSDSDQPLTLIADCNLDAARDKTLGPRNDALADRRLDLYGGEAET